MRNICLDFEAIMLDDKHYRWSNLPDNPKEGSLDFLVSLVDHQTWYIPSRDSLSFGCDGYFAPTFNVGFFSPESTQEDIFEKQYWLKHHLWNRFDSSEKAVSYVSGRIKWYDTLPHGHVYLSDNVLKFEGEFPSLDVLRPI